MKTLLLSLALLFATGAVAKSQKQKYTKKTIIGICGGFQILGQAIHDPLGIEGSIQSLPGIGLLSIETTMDATKKTRQVEFEFGGTRCKGYEIHQGVSTTDQLILQEGSCIGTYLHGFLDNPSVIEYILKDKVKKESETFNLEDFKERQYDLLAEHIRKHVDLPKLYEIMRA